MYKFLPVTLLSLLSLLGAPAISLAQTCVSLDGAPLFNPSPDPQLAKSQQGKEMAEIAIAFLKAGQPERAAQVNEQIRSRFKLQPKDLSTLVMIQYLLAEDQAAATAHLPKLDLIGFGDIDAIFLAMRTFPEKDQVAWMLDVVDRIPTNNGKLLWWTVLVELYPNRPETRKITEKMRWVLTQDAPLSEWINLAVVYRQAGDFAAARLLLESLADRARLDSRNISSRFKIAQELARIGHPEQARAELNQLKTVIVPGRLATNLELTHHLSLTYAAIGDLTAVSDLIQKLPNLPDPDSFYYKDRTRSQLARLFAEQGNIQQSQQFLLAMQDAKLQEEAAQAIIQHFLRQEPWADAAGASLLLETIASLVEPKLQALIAYKTAQANQIAASDRILSTMRGEYVDIIRLLQTTNALNQVGYHTKSRTLLKEALALAIQQKIPPLLLQIAVQFADAGDFEQANQLLDEQARIFEESLRSQETRSSMFEPLLLDTPKLDESALGRFFEYVRFSAPSFTPTQPVQSKLEAILVQPSLEDSVAIDLGSLATFYSRARNFVKADQFIQRIPDRYCNFKALILQVIVSEAITAKQPDIAQLLLAKYSRPTNQEVVRTNSIAIANLYLDQQRSEKAIALLEQALKLTSDQK